MLRLQKFLALAGLGSRRKCEDIIRSGRVRVNNHKAKIGEKVTKSDKVFVDNQETLIKEIQTRLLLLNKPRGVISSNSRKEIDKNVFDFLPKDDEVRWISVGRLDINTSGIMLFTNDGDLAHRLMHPSSNIDREYLVRARGTFNDKKKASMLRGININNKHHKLSDLIEGDSSGVNQWFTVCLMTGQNREVRKIFQYHDLQISRLKRVRFGTIFLPINLREGCFKELKTKDINSLLKYGKD